MSQARTPSDPSFTDAIISRFVKMGDVSGRERIGSLAHHGWPRLPVAPQTGKMQPEGVITWSVHHDQQRPA